jgi:hypothetical protein
MPESEGSHFRDQDYATSVAPVGPAFPDELERIRAERQFKRDQVVAALAFETVTIPVATVITRAFIAVTEVAYETVANKSSTYDLLNSISAMRVSTFLGATASAGLGLHLFNRNLQHYQQKRLNESKAEG